ncbi:MAG: hypothetical protein IT204_03925 [Fimbriimonadaceae bacterium]|nr:hypothetical protein [Fimbriimonadaceae bacterium]
MSDVAPRTWHLVFRATSGTEPFAEGVGRAAALQALASYAATGEAVILAFALLPAELDLLLSGGDGDELADNLRNRLSRQVNRALGRKGSLLGPALVQATDADWVALAEAIEERVVAAGLALTAAACPACSAAVEHASWVRQVPTSGPRAASLAAPPLRIGDVIRVAEVPTVVQLAAAVELAAQLRQPDPAASSRELLRDYVARWYLDDRRTLQVARTVLGGLARPTPGAGWFVTGLYGAGKSHLLAATALTAGSALARQELLAAQPALADLRAGLLAAGDRLVVAVALDQQSPGGSLEDAVFAAAGLALAELGCGAPLAEPDWVCAQTAEHLLPRWEPQLDAAAGGSWRQLAAARPAAAALLAQELVVAQRLPITFAQSRVERLGRLQELAAEVGRHGVLLVLDELAVFLAARDRAGLHADASFLQFLGQRSQHSPLWVLAALQKQIEDVGEIEHYTLRQIKDRFETRLALPLAAARQVLARKALPRHDGATLQAAVEACQRAWGGGARLTDLSVALLRESYPLHPLTLSILENCAERFLARTRSVIEFATTRVRGDELAPGILDRPATALLTPDELWDHFARDMVQHPDLRRYHEQVVRWYEEHLASLVSAPADRELALRAVKTLVLLRLAGLQRSLRDLAAALEPRPAGREERLRELLEQLRTGGNWLTVERRAGEAQDCYLVDLEWDANEVLRRRQRSLAATLRPGDVRLTQVAVGACDRPDFPLAAALHARRAEVVWRHSRRQLFLVLRDLSQLSGHELANHAALLAGPEVSECCYLFIAEPQATAVQAAAFEAALAEVPEQRWRRALAAWIPREASAAERRQWVDDAAAELLRADPSARAGPSGEALLARLDEDAPERLERLRELLGRLLAEGQLLTADGALPLAGNSWAELLEQAVGRCLDGVFPRYAELAPRGRLPAAGVAAELVEALVLPGELTVAPSSVRALQLEAIARPLGLLDGADGEYRLRLAADGPTLALLRELPVRRLGLADLELLWGRGPWGLPAELTPLVLAALLRRGFLQAVDDAGRPAPLRLPLRAHLAAVESVTLVEATAWETLRPLVTTLLGRDLPALTPAAQQGLLDRLVHWRAAVAAEQQNLAAAVAKVRAALNQEPLQWRAAETVAAQLAALSGLLDPQMLPAQQLQRLARALHGVDAASLQQLFERQQALRRFALDPDRLLHAVAELRAVELPSEHPLAAAREALLARLQAGDAAAFDIDPLLTDLTAWREAYAAAYREHHAAVHADQRYAAYDALRSGPLLRLLGNLSRLAVDVPESAVSVDAALREARGRQCRRADLTLLLAAQPVCPECRLPLGAELALPPAAELVAMVERGIADTLARLRAPAPAAELERGLRTLDRQDPRVAAARRLLDPASPVAELAAATSFAVVDLVNQLLTDQPAATRRLADLRAQLDGRRLALRQVRAVVDRWLDPAGDLADDDLVEFQE